MTAQPLFKDFQTTITAYGKENLGELLYALTESSKKISGCEQIRIYLEDLTRGTLTCVQATGPLGKELVESTFPIVSDETIVSRVFVSQQPSDFKISRIGKSSPDHDYAARFRFSTSYVMPIVSLGKSIGVLCIDRDHPAEVLSIRGKSQMAELCDLIADPLDQARI